MLVIKEYEYEETFEGSWFIPSLNATLTCWFFRGDKHRSEDYRVRWEVFHGGTLLDESFVDGKTAFQFAKDILDNLDVTKILDVGKIQEEAYRRMNNAK